MFLIKRAHTARHCGSVYALQAEFNLQMQQNSD